MKQLSRHGYPPVDQCIYCGKTINETKLTREHIIAKSIGGDVTLAKSSCIPCAHITRDIEQFCFREMLGAFRIRFGLRKSHPKGDPVKVHLKHLDGFQHFQYVPTDQHPSILTVPKAPPPQLVFGKSPDMNFITAWSYVPDPEVIKKYPQGTRIGGHQFRADTYGRMIAKIAHAFACAEMGHAAFEHLLPPIILEERGDVFDYVGCLGQEAADLPAEPGCLHRVHLEISPDLPGFVLANIRLFAQFGAPQYHVVVGKTGIG